MRESVITFGSGEASRRLATAHVLATGGAGFIGSYLCERLLNRGDEILCGALLHHKPLLLPFLWSNRTMAAALRLRCDVSIDRTRGTTDPHVYNFPTGTLLKSSLIVRNHLERAKIAECFWRESCPFSPFSKQEAFRGSISIHEFNAGSPQSAPHRLYGLVRN